MLRLPSEHRMVALPSLLAFTDLLQASEAHVKSVQTISVAIAVDFVCKVSSALNGPERRRRRTRSGSKSRRKLWLLVEYLPL